MANGEKHFEIGFLVGATFSGIKNYNEQPKMQNENSSCSFNWLELGLKMFFGGTIGGVTGVLPDIIEPATSPKHRKSFHSLAAASLIVMVVNRVNKNVNIPSEKKEYINIASLAYGSHLLLDAQTPAGIPII